MVAGLVDFGRLHVMLSQNIMEDREFADGEERRTNRIIFTSDADRRRIFYSLFARYNRVSIDEINRPYRHSSLALYPVISRKLQ